MVSSEQQLVDCSSAQGNGGCGGGWMDYAWNYLTSNDLGLMKLDDYPFTGQVGSKFNYIIFNLSIHTSRIL